MDYDSNVRTWAELLEESRGNIRSERNTTMDGNNNNNNGKTNAFQAQSELYNHIFNFIDSMALNCAVRLGIPDAIHRNGRPIDLSQLCSTLDIPPSKIPHLYRLMRVLVHSRIFSLQDHGDDPRDTTYSLTPVSHMLLRADGGSSLAPFVVAMLDPVLLAPWNFLGEWFVERNEGATPFRMAHNGMNLWEYGRGDPGFNSRFNMAMASDSGMMNFVIGECSGVFEGLESLVDLGGGTGTAARIICSAFPRMKVTVLDFPHVVGDLVHAESGNLSFVGADLFEFVPPADAMLLKLMFHSWSDEECVKVLRKCKEAISDSRNKHRKVVIVDIVIRDDKDDVHETSTKLYFDLLMMAVVTGRERSEKEWEKLFKEAGFRCHKVTPLFGLRSLIEVYP